MTNPIDEIIKKNHDSLYGITQFQPMISRPINWKPNIHEAAFYGDEFSVKYCLQFISIKGNTPMHIASKGCRGNVVKLLIMLGADYNVLNDEGFLPVHMSDNKFMISLFSNFGLDLNKRNQNDESLLEIKTKNFDMNIFQNILSNEYIDIFEPNPKGIYWMQYAIHSGYYKKQMTTFQFKKKSSILHKNVSHFYLNY